MKTKRKANPDYINLINNLKKIYNLDYINPSYRHAYHNIYYQGYSFKDINETVSNNFEQMKSVADRDLYYGCAMVKHLMGILQPKS